MKAFVFFLFMAESGTLIAEEKPYAPESIPGAAILSAEEVVELIPANAELG